MIGEAGSSMDNISSAGNNVRSGDAESRKGTNMDLITMSESGAKRWSTTTSTPGDYDCEMKALAARRKRLEIRRFKMMSDTGAFEEEPPLKRPKVEGTIVCEVKKSATGSASGEEGKGRCTCKGEKEIAATIRVEVSSTLSCVVGAIEAGKVKGRVAEDKVEREVIVRGVVDITLKERSAWVEEQQTTAPGGGDESKGQMRVDRSESLCPAYGVVSVCGRSRVMEDAAVAWPAFLTLPAAHSTDFGESFHFFGVYDGHGGAQAADFCKERLHATLAEEMRAAGGHGYGNSPDAQWVAAMEASFTRLDAELGGLCLRNPVCKKPAGKSFCCREARAPETVGSTAVVAVVSAQRIIVANCGDSRAVLCRGGHAVPLSTDHKPSRSDELARIEAAGGRVIAWNGYRVLGVLAMSRALGDRYLKPFVIAQPEITCTPRSGDDECLILASDGLWDVLSNEFACSVARRCLAGWRKRRSSDNDDGREETPAQAAAALLTKLALAKDSRDNISVVVVDLKSHSR